MDRVSKNIWLVRAAAIAIFLLGFAAGAFAPMTYRAWVRNGGRGGGPDRFDQMSERLKLSPGQRTQVEQIFGETRTKLEALREESAPRYAEIRRQADERLRQVLTPEQWQQFQQSRDENRPRGRRGRAREGVPRPQADQ